MEKLEPLERCSTTKSFELTKPAREFVNHGLTHGCIFPNRCQLLGSASGVKTKPAAAAADGPDGEGEEEEVVEEDPAIEMAGESVENVD